MNAVIPNNRAKASNPSFAIVDRTLTMTGFASATKPGISLDKTFAAFRYRKKENTDWIESRTKSAYEFLGDQTDLSEEAKRVRNLSSTLGLPEDVILRLRDDVLKVTLGKNSTISDWVDWMLDGLASYSLYPLMESLNHPVKRNCFITLLASVGYNLR